MNRKTKVVIVSILAVLIFSLFFVFIVGAAEGFAKPLETLKVTNKFTGSAHWGVDYSGKGNPIYATKAGTVIKAETGAGSWWGCGNFVIIKHDDGYTTRYQHMDEVPVVYDKVGQRIEQGAVLGYVGNTGNTSGDSTQGYHLHLDLISNNGQNPQNTTSWQKNSSELFLNPHPYVSTGDTPTGGGSSSGGGTSTPAPPESTYVPAGKIRDCSEYGINGYVYNTKNGSEKIYAKVKIFRPDNGHIFEKSQLANWLEPNGGGHGFEIIPFDNFKGHPSGTYRVELYGYKAGESEKLLEH
jgi:Membrane proteins related to metalloendopeptidases